MKKGQAQEIKAKALLHLDQAFDGVVAATKIHSPSTLSFHSAIRFEGIIDDVGNNDENTSNDNVLSCTDSPEGLNQLVTISCHTSRTRKGVHGILELERVQKNVQDVKEMKLKIDLSYSRSMRIASVKKQEQHSWSKRIPNSWSHF